MAQNANDMINGTSCTFCGVFFKKQHGYPVVCTDCFDDSTTDELTGLQKATNQEY